MAVRHTAGKSKYIHLLATLKPQGILQFADSYNVPATETAVRQYKEYKTRIINKYSALAEMGDRFATIDIG